MNIMDGALISGRLGRIADALDRMSPPEPKSLGEITVNIKINKDEILRELDEILKKVDEVNSALKKFAPFKPATDYIVINHGDGSSTTVTYADTPHMNTGEVNG